MKKSDIIIILLIVIIIVLIFIVAPAKAFTSMHRGDVNITGLLNNTEMGKIYLNDTIWFAYTNSRPFLKIDNDYGSINLTGPMEIITAASNVFAVGAIGGTKTFRVDTSSGRIIV